MSAPFLYTSPNAPQVNYRNSPYLAPFYAQQNSPFIPDLSLNASPYASPYAQAASLPPSPNLNHSPLPSPFAPNYIPFPGSPVASPFIPPAWPRERRVSWNAGLVSPVAQNTTWLQPPVRQRTQSDVTYPYQQPVVPNAYWTPPSASPYNPFVSLPPTQFFIHPYLNGEAPRSDLVFNLSAREFMPLKYIGNNQTVPISLAELGQIATNPPIYKLKISCDYLIPNWPMELNFGASNPYFPAPPIKVGDVLSAIYYQLQKQISQHEWAQLTPEHEHMVSRAYTKRCKSLGSAELMSLNQGVKQIDFLLGKIWFKGLVRTTEGPEHFKLMVS